MPTLFYIHDPMCSWCYGFSQTLKSVLNKIPDSVKVRRLLGGLAPDNDNAMSDEMQRQIHANWRRIEQSIPGVKFNHDFWTECVPRRSTYPSCRAVIAARAQGNKFDVLMTEAIQNAYYQQARNPSDVNTLIELANEISLDVDRFRATLSSAQTDSVLKSEINLSEQLGAYSYPSLLLKNVETVQKIDIDYISADAILTDINNCLASVS